MMLVLGVASLVLLGISIVAATAAVFMLHFKLDKNLRGWSD